MTDEARSVETYIERFVAMASLKAWAFLHSYHDWCERRAPDEEPYSRRHGLCHAAWRFDRTAGVAREIEAIFGGDYPFGAENYDARVDTATQHLDPLRLAFVAGCLAREPEHAE